MVQEGHPDLQGVRHGHLVGVAEQDMLQIGVQFREADLDQGRQCPTWLSLEGRPGPLGHTVERRC